jgi:phospholipase/carboxylesterase
MKSLSGPEIIPKKVKQAVIFLHGLGSNGDDLLGLAPLMQDALPNTAFLAPNAPYAVPMIASGFQWFELWDRSPMQIEQGIRAAAPLIADYVEEIAERFDIPVSKIALVGFSQGTMVGLHAGLRVIDGLAGIVGFAGAMMTPETLHTEKLKKMPPVLLVHGMQDNVVPFFASQQAEMMIKLVGGTARFVQRPFLLHSIDNEGIKECIDFLQNVFGDKK